MEETKFTALNLDNMAIASPCAASWEDMEGDDRTKHCSSCTKNVYNLSDMTRAEAEALIKEKEGHLCVRFYRRKDGTVITDDCPVGLRAIRAGYRKMATAVASFLALLVSTGVALAGEGNANSGKADEKCVKQPNEPRTLMGDVSAPRATMGEAVAPPPRPALMGAPAAMRLPEVTQGEAWLPKFQKSVEDQLKDSLGAKINAPSVQFYLTLAENGSVVAFSTLGNSVSQVDQKVLERVRQLKFKAFPKETKLKQVIILAKIIGSKPN